MTMHKPEALTARQLAALLAQYGDMRVDLCVLFDGGNVCAELIRPEMCNDKDGRYLSLTGYPAEENDS